jgi:hypothetical protein
MIRYKDLVGKTSISHLTGVVRGEPVFNRLTLVIMAKGADDRVHHYLVGDRADEFMGRLQFLREEGCLRRLRGGTGGWMD